MSTFVPLSKNIRFHFSKICGTSSVLSCWIIITTLKWKMTNYKKFVKHGQLVPEKLNSLQYKCFPLFASTVNVRRDGLRSFWFHSWVGTENRKPRTACRKPVFLIFSVIDPLGVLGSTRAFSPYVFTNKCKNNYVKTLSRIEAMEKYGGLIDGDLFINL